MPFEMETADASIESPTAVTSKVVKLNHYPRKIKKY